MLRGFDASISLHNPLLDCVPLSPPDAYLWSALLDYCFLCSLRSRLRDSCCHAPCLRGYALLHSNYSSPSLSVPKVEVALLPASILSLLLRLTPLSTPTLRHISYFFGFGLSVYSAQCFHRQPFTHNCPPHSVRSCYFAFFAKFLSS